MSEMQYTVRKNSSLIKRSYGFILGGEYVEDISLYTFNFALYLDPDEPLVLKQGIDYDVFDLDDPEGTDTLIQALDFTYLTADESKELESGKYRFSAWASLGIDDTFKQPLENGIIIIKESGIV